MQGVPCVSAFVVSLLLCWREQLCMFLRDWSGDLMVFKADWFLLPSGLPKLR